MQSASVSPVPFYGSFFTFFNFCLAAGAFAGFGDMRDPAKLIRTITKSAADDV